MQLIFTSPDGAPISAADPRLVEVSASDREMLLPRERRPAAWPMGKMQVTLPEDRRPAGWIITAMKV